MLLRKAMHIRNLVIRPNKSLLCENKTMTEWERVAWQDGASINH
jgi:hypothetical protein